MSTTPKPTPEELRDLRKRYAPSVIPPCRVCGAELAMQAIGGGQPTRYACSVAASARPTDWDHYRRSEHEDRRQGGDEDVIRVIDAFEASQRAIVAEPDYPAPTEVAALPAFWRARRERAGKSASLCADELERALAASGGRDAG